MTLAVRGAVAAVAVPGGKAKVERTATSRSATAMRPRARCRLHAGCLRVCFICEPPRNDLRDLSGEESVDELRELLRVLEQEAVCGVGEDAQPCVGQVI